jgi:hypothetical protein
MRRILLYGSSLLMSGLAASLAGRPDLAVFQVGRADQVASLAPEALDVAIVDLNSDSLNPLTALLGQYPHLLVLGLDSAQQTLTLLSGSQHPAHSLDDLIHWLSAPDPGPAAQTRTSS